jgi:hypothetical protein
MNNQEDDDHIGGSDGPRLGLLWVIGLLVVFGPYLGIA